MKVLLLLLLAVPALANTVKPVQLQLHPVLTGRAPDLALGGLSVSSKLRVDGQAVRPLGRGEFGVVYPHPRVEGAVIKVVEPSAEAVLFGFGAFTPKSIADEEEATARAYAAAGAGPRYLGRAVVDGRLVSVRERVYGEQVDRMIADRRFRDEELGLMYELLAKMARERLKSDDLRLPNVMIGTTALDPARRAYVVDGGKLLEFPDGQPEPERLAALVEHPVRLHARLDPFVGVIEHTRPLRELLEEGVDRAGDDTAWKRFKRFFKEMKNAPMYGNPMR